MQLLTNHLVEYITTRLNNSVTKFSNYYLYNYTYIANVTLLSFITTIRCYTLLTCACFLSRSVLN